MRINNDNSNNLSKSLRLNGANSASSKRIPSFRNASKDSIIRSAGRQGLIIYTSIDQQETYQNLKTKT